MSLPTHLPELRRIERHACFGGWQEVWEHPSMVLDCRMRFGLFLPPQLQQRRCPVVYWLSGLTCSEQNFITKAGAQRYAAELGLILVVPDTSPRGEGVPDAPERGLGLGAGFYLNATEAPWSRHYRMYDYVVAELPALVERQLPCSGRRSVIGHSMGGLGALVVGLRNPQRYACCSALAPISAPASIARGQQVFTAYLGAQTAQWAAYDPCELLQARARAGEPALPPIRIDQGSADEYLGVSITPERIAAACVAAGQPLRQQTHAGYDHSYYFVASFIGQHLAEHAVALSA